MAIRNYRPNYFLIRLQLFALLLGISSGALAVEPRTIVVGTAGFRPTAFIASGDRWAGLSVTVLDEVAAQEGWKISRFTAPWGELLKKLESGEIDILEGITYSADRANRFDFSNESLMNNWAVVYAPIGTSISSLPDLDGKTIAVSKRSAHTEALNRLAKEFGVEFKSVVVGGFANVFDVVSKGEADGGLVSRTFGTGRGADYELLPTPIVLDPKDVGYAVKKGTNRDLLSAIDRYLVAAKSNPGSTYNRAVKQWLGGSSKTEIPDWLIVTILVISISLIIALILAAILRRQVRKRTFELGASEKRLRRAILNAPVPIMLHTEPGEVLMISKQWEKITGYAHEDIPTVNEWTNRAYGGQPPIIAEALDKAYRVDADNVDVGTFVVTTASGEKRTWTFYSSQLGSTAKGDVLLITTAQDITESKQAEEQLRQSQKMEAVGQLTGGVAHDFNNLLAVILGNAEIVEDRRGENDDSVKAIIRAAERGAQLTQRLLAFSRRQPLDSKPIDLGALVGDVHQLLHRTLGETIDIEIATAPSLWNAVADPGQLESALLNLALNARDAMPDGGKLIIEAANVPLNTNDGTSHMEVAPGDYVSLSVSDTGSGMPPEVMEHAFEPFFTTRDVGEGSGLGLSMVYGFVKQSGGDITIESNPGHGTTVKLFLPRAKAAIEQPIQSDALSVPKARGETVLVVEDEPDVLAVAETMLENLGYRVLSAENARAGLDILKTEPAIDLLLSDVVLPGSMSGPDMTEHAKAIAPGIKVLFMSGYAESSIHLQTPLPEGSDLLDKPFRTLELARRVRAVLDR
jgi:PAS domain S-box-containing protein